MRLSNVEIEAITRLAIGHFGRSAEVYLFGSRTNNRKRGGDIDLFIRSSDGAQLKIKSKIDFITDLIMEIGEQKIDVILDRVEKQDSGLFKTISQTGVRLC